MLDFVAWIVQIIFKNFNEFEFNYILFPLYFTFISNKLIIVCIFAICSYILNCNIEFCSRVGYV